MGRVHLRSMWQNNPTGGQNSSIGFSSPTYDLNVQLQNLQIGLDPIIKQNPGPKSLNVRNLSIAHSWADFCGYELDIVYIHSTCSPSRVFWTRCTASIHAWMKFEDVFLRILRPGSRQPRYICLNWTKLSLATKTPLQSAKAVKFWSVSSRCTWNVIRLTAFRPTI